MTKPLAGCRVLELAGIGPGPFAGMFLADLGAEVVRVDRPGGSGFFAGSEHVDIMNRGKQSLLLDLKKPEAVDVLLRMVEHADVLIEGYRPGVAEKLGVGPEACLARNPKLVYGRITGWGQDGPLAQSAGHDIDYIALTGALHAIGPADGAPQIPLNLLGDFGGGGGSAQQAVHFAAQGVMSGTADLIVAGGVQKMSQFPILSAFGAGEPFGSTDPWTGSKGWAARYGNEEISQFRGAEMIADQWNLSREDNEKFAYESHQRALKAIAEGRFEREITEFEGISTDEGPRADTSLEKMSGLKTLTEGGKLTAAVASQISDGSAALLVASEAAVERYGFTPRARIHHISVRGADPVMMLAAPIPATQHALKKAGLSIDDIDAVEINEAFAPVVLAWLADIGADPAKVNINGGAIALGHPIGCTGSRLMTSLLHELERTGGRYGLQTMCEGGGQANVTIIERL